MLKTISQLKTKGTIANGEIADVESAYVEIAYGEIRKASQFCTLQTHSHVHSPRSPGCREREQHLGAECAVLPKVPSREASSSTRSEDEQNHQRQGGLREKNEAQKLQAQLHLLTKNDCHEKNDSLKETEASK